MIETRFKDLREDHDLSQEQMGKILNMKQQTYSNYETGRRRMSWETILKLADFYNVSLDYIFKRTNKKEMNK